MTILLLIYIIGFGAFAILSLRLPSDKQSSWPLLSAFMVGIFWPIVLFAGFCIGFYRAMKGDLGGNNKANH